MLVGGGGAGGEGGRGGRETSQQSSTSTSFPSFHRLATPTSLVGGGGEESSLDGYVDESDATTAASGSVSNVKGKKGRTKKGSVSGKKESAGRKVALNVSFHHQPLYTSKEEGVKKLNLLFALLLVVLAFSRNPFEPRCVN